MFKFINTTLAIGFLLAFGLGASTCQRARIPKVSKSDTSRQVFGISVRKSTLNLIKKVEKLYGFPLCVTSYEELEKCGFLTAEVLKESLASSSISKEGVPIVLLRENTKNETTLVHELFHLKRKSEGYPILQYNIDSRLQAEARELNYTVVFLFHAMMHHSFYQEMRKMGIDPDMHTRLETYESMKTSPHVPQSKIEEALMASFYVRRAIECGNECIRENTMGKYAAWYESAGLHDVLSKAKASLDIFERNNPSTPEAYVKTAFECAQRLLEGEVIITPMEWTAEKIGNVVEKRAPYHAGLP